MSHRVPHLGLRYLFVFSGLLTPVLIAYLIFSPGALLGAAQQASPDYVAPLVLFEGKADATKVEQPSTSPSGRSQGHGKKQRPQTAEGVDESAGKTSSGEQKANRPQFVRLLVRKNEPQYLQTAIVSYVVRDDSSQGKTLSAGETGRSQPAWPKDLRVDLVGVIHIADRGYYEQLNKILRKYDVVLYELVAPEGTRVTPGQRPAHPVSALQQSLTNMLGLAYQLDVIDYHRPNFVHADLSPEEFYQSMKEKGESTWAMLLRAFGYEWARSLSRQSTPNDADLVRALFSKDRQLQLKRLFAQQLSEDVEGQIRALEGPQGSTLISGRNERVLAVLEDQAKKGAKSVAIFYGAGHMPHFHDRLTQIGFAVEKTRWLNAWDLRSPVADSTERTGN